MDTREYATTIAPYLRDHPAMMAKIDEVAAILRDQMDVNMQMHLITDEDAARAPGVAVGAVMCCDRIDGPQVAFIIRPDGTAEQVIG